MAVLHALLLDGRGGACPLAIGDIPNRDELLTAAGLAIVLLFRFGRWF